MSINPENLERQFFSDGYKLGTKAAENGTSKQNLYKSIREMHSAIDQFTDYLAEFAAQNNQKIDCKKGCAWCCHQPIFALSYELDYLNAFLNKRFDKNKLEEIAKRAEIKKKKLENLEEKKLLNSKHPCPLLENNSCIAYEARPVACRIYLSTEVKSCIHFFEKPDDDTQFPALLNLPMRLGRMMNEGFKSALKANGITCKEFRIEEKILSDDEN